MLWVLIWINNRVEIKKTGHIRIINLFFLDKLLLCDVCYIEHLDFPDKELIVEWIFVMTELFPNPV